MRLLIPLEIQDSFLSVSDGKYGLIKSSTVTAAKALMLEDTVLRKIQQNMFQCHTLN